MRLLIMLLFGSCSWSIMLAAVFDNVGICAVEQALHSAVQRMQLLVDKCMHRPWHVVFLSSLSGWNSCWVQAVWVQLFSAADVSLQSHSARLRLQVAATGCSALVGWLSVVCIGAGCINV